MYNRRENLITSNEGWPQHLSEYELQSQHLVRELLTEVSPERFHLLVRSFLDVLHSTSLFDKTIGRVLNRKKTDQDSINDLIELLTNNEELFASIQTSLLGQNEIDTDKYNFEYYKPHETYKCVYAMYNQQIGQLFFQALQNEHKHQIITKLSVFLHVIANHRNQLTNPTQQSNTMLSFLNAGKAHAGIAHILTLLGGKVVFPNYTDIKEVAEWDVHNGVDFACYLQGQMLLVDSQGRERKRRSTMPYDSVFVGRNDTSDLAKSRLVIAKQALKELKLQKAKGVTINESDLKHAVVGLTIRVPTDPSMMNHIGRLSHDLMGKAEAELRQQGIII